MLALPRIESNFNVWIEESIVRVKTLSYLPEKKTLFVTSLTSIILVQAVPNDTMDRWQNVVQIVWVGNKYSVGM